MRWWRECGLTPRSTGPATAGHLGPVWGTRYIVPVRAKASCRTGSVSSNVRQRKHHFRSSYPEMQAFTWSPTEKQLARAVFEVAAAAEEQEVLARFKTRAAALKNLEDLWSLQFAIKESEREYQQKYDYRYSQLIHVFGRLVREGRISVEALHGLSEEKLKHIERIASL